MRQRFLEELPAPFAMPFMRENPWLAVWPGVAIGLAVYGFNIFGDALRDVLDPRLCGSF
jgi:peptide/nickel transport system permease protein